MQKKGRTLDSLAATPIILAGHHEPLSFRRRSGFASVNEQERFAYEHSEEMADILAGRGITWVRAHFFKGSGLAAEAEEIDQTARWIERLHKRGIKVELYTQFGTLQYEAFLAEAPDCLDWCAVGVDNQLHTIVYGHHDFRGQPCLVREGYWKYFEKVLKKGIAIGADGFGFDNVCNTKLPDACHCPECRAAFVAYLKDKYRPDTRAGAKLTQERFGFAVLDHIRPPLFNRWNPVSTCTSINSPVFQEWTDFRTENLARRVQDIWHCVKDKRPDIMLEYNVYPRFGSNAAWHDGIDMHKILPWMDLAWNERAPSVPRLTTDKCLWNRVHAYKLAELYGNAVITFHMDGMSNMDPTPGQQALSISESLTFNGGHIGGFGYLLSFIQRDQPEAEKLIAFRKAHGDLYEKTSSIAKVGLVESALNLARNCAGPHHTEIQSMISLMAAHVPFDLVSELTAEKIAAYDALVLPDVECMSNEEAAILLDYVRKGGGVVLIGRTGMYDAWRRRRQQSTLTEMLKASKNYKGIGSALDSHSAIDPSLPVKSGNAVFQGAFEKGRFAYLSQLIPVGPCACENEEINGSLWRIPGNFKEFSNAVRFVQGAPDIEVNGPQEVAVEIRATPDGRTLIHLLNYKIEKDSAPVRIHLKNRDVSGAKLFVAGQASPKTLKVIRNAKNLTLPVGRVPGYAVVELN